MLAKKNRLIKSPDFLRVRREGQSVACRTLVLVRRANGLDGTRFGFSISKRVGNAVVRNRLKRLLSEVVRLHIDLVSSGWDVVIIARRPVVGCGYQRVERDVIGLLRSAQLFRGAEELASDRE